MTDQVNQTNTEDQLDKIYGAHKGATLATLTVHYEVLNRIMRLKDEANYLEHPKFIVQQAVKFILKVDKNKNVTDLLKTLVD